MTQHHIDDILLYLTFLAGQLFYIMKRAGFSVRAGRCKTRWDYVYQNWDILSFRSVLEFIFIYMPFRHWTPDQILTVFRVKWDWLMSDTFMQTAVNSPVAFLGLGIASDGLFDWLVDWASRSPKVPTAVKNWLTENVQNGQANKDNQAKGG